MKNISNLIHLMGVEADLFDQDHDSDWHIKRVSTELLIAFSESEIELVEDFLSSLSEFHLKVLSSGTGAEVSNLYARQNLPAEDQMIIEEVVNAIFEES